MQRKFGTGSVTRRVRKNSRVQYWARGPQINGRRESLGYFDDYNEAALVAGVAAEELGVERIEAASEPTFLAYAKNIFLPRMQLARPQSHATYARRIKRIQKAAWVNAPLRDIIRRDIKAWLEERMRLRKNKRITIRADLSVIKAIFNHAIDDERLDASPALGLKVEKDTSEAPPQCWADIEMQRKMLLSEHWSMEDKLPLAVVMMTGLRKWEFLALQLGDIHWDTARLYIQRGTKGGPTKSKKSRWVPLIGPAFEALRVWVHEVLPSFCKCNPMNLVFPGPRGAYRTDWVDRKWRMFRDAESIKMRFHDLRHTAGSSLVNGDWDRKWSLMEVRDMLGHSTVKQTEIYAHVSLSSIDEAAACTTGSVVHAALFEATKQELSVHKTLDPVDPIGIPWISTSRPLLASARTTNGPPCTTGARLSDGAVVDICALLKSHPLGPVAQALSSMRCA